MLLWAESLPESFPWNRCWEMDLEQTLSLIDRSHMTFIGPRAPEGEMLASDGAAEILKHLGYRYRISHMDIKMDYFRQSFKVELVWKNDGAAPIYFEWPVMMYIYDAERKQTLLGRRGCGSDAADSG